VFGIFVHRDLCKSVSSKVDSVAQDLLVVPVVRQSDGRPPTAVTTPKTRTVCLELSESASFLRSKMNEDFAENDFI